MGFLYEKQTRRFYFFLAAACILQVCFLGAWGIFQTQNIRRILTERELAAASYLLHESVPKAVVAAAWNNREVTEEGARLLGKIGHTEYAQSYWLMLTEPESMTLLLILVGAGILFAAVILVGAAYFLRGRERVYEDAGRVIDQYAANHFAMHLPSGETGTIYQLFGSIEQLAQSLQAKSEMEYKAKIFLRDMISNISHQLKTPLAALGMYMEIILEEPENKEAVEDFAGKSILSLERMEQLIRSLLTMARMDTGNIVFEKRKCLVSEMMEQAVEDLMERARCEGKEEISGV